MVTQLVVMVHWTSGIGHMHHITLAGVELHLPVMLPLGKTMEVILGGFKFGV